MITSTQAVGIKKSVNIQISEKDLETLKTSKYRLCFAKKVNNSYSVVWQSYQDYLSNNEFSWTPVYQLFGTNKFADDVLVVTNTNIQSIGIGMQCTLDPSGFLGSESTYTSATSFRMVNEYGPIHPGVNQLSTGIDGKSISTPIYVAADDIVKGHVDLTPVEKIQVWFEQNIETSTMFSDARSNAVEIDLTNVDSATRVYENGQWIIP